MLVLTAGVYILAHAAPGSVLGSLRIVNADLGLVAMIVVFDIFAIYQRIVVTRLRRKLAIQIATIATLEAMTSQNDTEEDSVEEKRNSRRSDADSLLKLEIVRDGSKHIVYGRLHDMSHGGIGAIIPDVLRIGDVVKLTFNTERVRGTQRAALVRHRRGFRYGFEFLAKRNGASTENSPSVESSTTA
jgi:hypothetical protein